MSRIRAGAALILVLPMLAACTAQLSPGSADAPTPVGFTVLRLDLPFDEYKWKPRDIWSLERGRQILVKRCVRGRGLNFTMPENTGAEAPPDVYDNSRRYGVADENAASRFGYHLPVRPDQERRRNRIEAWNKGVSEAEEAAIYGGNGQPGCYQQIDSFLERGLPRADTDWLSAQSADSLRRTEQLEAVTRAKEDWRRCMSRLGFAYANPDAAIGDPRWDLDAPAITEREIETAQADVRCKQSSGLLKTWHEAERTLQHQIIQRNLEKFDLLRAGKNIHLSNVSRAVAAE
ncbi:hypothetical protein ITP53_03105 [Nonomuraea sp. K274]|uniref:Lipoprotein n=1 Tax=Nonomuraea cypriaca TaxID=1187855 RepID=A0A931EW16_9ACTN|nr:hypothetical protein [Nonomuraea cypriaca]MBF8184745.1 hypothetical protein [Nonomuraea cypriaca]